MPGYNLRARAESGGIRVPDMSIWKLEFGEAPPRRPLPSKMRRITSSRRPPPSFADEAQFAGDAALDFNAWRLRGFDHWLNDGNDTRRDPRDRE